MAARDDDEIQAPPDGDVTPPRRRRLSTPAVPPSALSTPELLREVMKDVGELARTQVELAVTEARADLRAEAGALEALGISALCALCALNLLLVAAALALARVLPGWAAALVVAGVVALAALVTGLLGWNRRVRVPLKRTRRALEEDTRWSKRRTV